MSDQTDMVPTNGTTTLSAQSMEALLLQGDLSKLQPAARVQYMTSVCQSLGLNPLTKPFEFLTLNGKMVMYAKRDCTEQLRKIHRVSITITSREETAGCYIVTARAQDASGRQDESVGAVSIEGLKGENRSNAMMKAETKAKRRVTLSICGLGMLDESEAETLPGAKAVTYEPPKEAAPAVPKAQGGTSAGMTSQAATAAASATSAPQSTQTNTKPARANTIKHDGNLATKDQIAKLHALRGKVGGLTEDAYRKQLAAFKDEDGKPCQHSNDLSVAQISNLIDRYEAKIAQQAKRAEEQPDIAAVVPPQPTLEELLTDKSPEDGPAAWLQRYFGASHVQELSADDCETAFFLLTKVGTDQYPKAVEQCRAMGRIQ